MDAGSEAVREGGRGIKILEGLAASGLRAIRYALEVRFLLPVRVFFFFPSLHMYIVLKSISLIENIGSSSDRLHCGLV